MSNPLQLNNILLYGSLAIISIFVFVYAYFRFAYTYWARIGVPYLKPKFPIGNNDCFGTEAFAYGLESLEWYKELKKLGHKFGGVYSWANPVLVVTDPDYIKDVLLKDFSYFADRDFYHNPKHDPKNESVFVVEKDEWRNQRQKMTPTFTSAKMRMMFDAVVKCSEPMLEVFAKDAITGNDMNVKEVFASFTTDVIGCIAFGLNCGSFDSQDAKFRQMGIELFKSTTKSKFFIVLTRISAMFARKIGIRNVPEQVTDFFANVVTETYKYRKESNEKKSDFMQLLIDLYKSTKDEEKPFTFDDLIGNVILFFIAGFDTSSTTMHFAMYELARNPDVQEKTRKEIQNVLNKHNGNLTYDAFQEMTYLRQVIDESLRIYPPVLTLARKCIKPYKFKDTDFTLEPGVSVVVSTIGLARDPEYFPDPERFDPDRFSPENKPNIKSCTYLPFGEGPRNCIGNRFGLMQVSIGLIQILKDYRVSISPKTEMPLTLKHGTFLMATNSPLYLKIEKL